MIRQIKTLVVSIIILCVHTVYAQNCKTSELSPKGLEHLNKAKAYLELINQGTHEQVIAEYEAIIQTDSIWCPDVYLQLGKLCEYLAMNKNVTYYDKAIRYYRKYNSFVPNDEIAGKIVQLETKNEVMKRSLGLDAINSGVKIEMILVEGMLNKDTTACIHSFYIGKYEVTQTQWQSVMDDNPSYFRGPNLPVERIASKYELFLSELNRLTGANYRLPTLVEWFYAARGGKSEENYSYSGGFAENKVAWFASNSGNRTHTVGEKDPNSLGIYDMSGNVSEICLVEKDYYNGGIEKTHRAYGGCYNSPPLMLKDDSYGKALDADYWGRESNNIGLRLVLDVNQNSMSEEERQWDSWIKQKTERLQKTKEKELKKQRRRNRFSQLGEDLSYQFGLNFAYNFQAYGEGKADDVFVNNLFQHTMAGLSFRVIGEYLYLEPQVKVGIESDWRRIAEQNGFMDQLSTCFDNVQLVHVEIPLIIGGIYKTDWSAIRGYAGGQFCPLIQTKHSSSAYKCKPYFSLLFGVGIDLGYGLGVDLYYRKPIKADSGLVTQGFTASLSFLFGDH